MLGPSERLNVVLDVFKVICREIAEVHAEMMTFSGAFCLMLDRALVEEGTFVGKCDDEFDCFVEVASGEIVGDVDADAGLTDVTGIEDVGGPAAHDLDLNGGAVAGGDPSVGAGWIQEGGETAGGVLVPG